MEKKKNTPKLRFPEFKGEWEEKKLGEIFKIFNGYAFSSSDSVDAGIPWVKIADVGIQCMNKSNLSFLPDYFKIKYHKFLLRKGDFVIALTRPILNGKLKIAQIDDYYHDSLLNQRVGKIETENDSIFIYSVLQKDEIISQIENNIAGTDPPNLSPSEINDIMTFIPIKAEQTKIATFLTAVDEKLTQLKKKKTLLEQYKKGVMQKLFSQELRFKDDNNQDFPDWQELPLDKTADIVGGGTPDTSNELLWNGNIQWFTPTELKFKYVKFSNRNITDEGLKQSSAKLLPVGTVLFSSRATIGDASITLKECATNQGFQSFVVGDNLYNEYLYYWIINNKNVFLMKASGSTFLEISKNEVAKINIELPSLPEQQKIANFLSTIDEKISHCGKQIEKMEAWKKGLLQQMFC